MNMQATAPDVEIATEGVVLEGSLSLPANARGMIVFAHGSGSSRFSPRNNYVAGVLHTAGFGTLLMDLLTREEDATYTTRFDIDLLTRRVVAATRWLLGQPQYRGLALGYFGASTGAAAALWAAAELPGKVRAVVSRGGRPDLAMEALDRVQAPTLLIVGARDEIVIELNREAYAKIDAEKEISIVPGATHLFEETGALEEVARLAAAWFTKHLGRPAQP